MEPAAPGTEDDPICNQDLRISRKDTLEAHALSKKAILPNGKYDNIFLLEYVDGAQHWYCKVCDRPVLGRIFNHEVGKKHVARLKLGNNYVEDDEDDEDKKGSLVGAGMVVAPGEPLPPGFEGEVEETKTHIQDRLDKFSVGPLVGLEYLLELLNYDPSKEPSYMCILCHKKGDPRTILTHLASYNHQVAYLQRHFPSAYRRIAPYMIKVYKRNWQAGLQKICDAIEATFGRLKPIQVDAGKYDKDSVYYMEMVAKGKHFNELSGQTFENVVTVEELTKVHDEKKVPIDNPPKRKSPSPPVVAKPVKRPKPQVENVPRKRSLSPVSDVSSSDLEDFDMKSPPKPKERKIPQRMDRSPPSKREAAFPWQRSSYRRDRPAHVAEKHKDEKAEKMEQYKRLAKAIDNQMEQNLKKHKENPEKHPKYNDEWKKFWNTRYKELQAEGKNAATHDFKPEWIEFWNKRMLELHQEEVKASKVALRKRLGLPEEPAPISFKIGERRKLTSASNKPVPTAAQPDNDPEVIVIEDAEEDVYKSRRNRSKTPTKKRDRSPQYRRRSPVRESPLRRRKSPAPSPPLPAYRRNPSPPPPARRRVVSPLRFSPPAPTMRISESPPPPKRQLSPLSRRKNASPFRRAPSPPKRQLSPLSRRKNASPFQRAPSPPTRLKEERFSASPARERSPRREKYDRLRDVSEDRSMSRGKSREISWERERERRRDYDEKHWDRPYRKREPWELDHHYPIDPYAPPKVLRDVTRQPLMEPEEVDEDDGNVNIVAILRLLTALEEKLGSLGPKVIDLLAQALAMEKKKANSSEELLDSEINCVLFETVKEKLKGQLQAGLVSWVQEKAFKNAIKKTASLIHIAGERKKQKEQELPKKPVVVPGIGKVDKGKIARQIANALIAQGKTDVTQDELEELINAVVGIAEAQKNSSETLTTASFLEKLSNAQIAKETQKAEPKVEPKPAEKEDKEPQPEKMDEDQISSSSLDKITMNMESLSDSDLETLLQNFKDLSSDEQLGLINYLKKLEAKEPERVEKLRKFVNLPEERVESERYSPFMAKMEESATKNVEPEKREKEVVEEEKTEKKEEEEDNSGFVDIDSDDEYSFEDVAKAVSQKVNESEREQKRLEDKNLDDAKAFITSLMSSLNKSALTNAPAAAPASEKKAAEKINLISNIPVSSADIAKSLSGITMSVSSLGNILGNVKSMVNNRLQPDKPPELSNPTPPSSSQGSVMSNPPSLIRNPYNPSEPPRGKSYNDFDIASQRDLNSSGIEYNPQPYRGRPNKPYDEFNIEPIPRDAKEDARVPGPLGNRFPEKPPVGFSDMPASSKLAYPERPLLERPLPHLQGPALRGNAQERGSQPYSGQFSPRSSGPLSNKPRPGVGNFEPSVGRGDFGPRVDDFRTGLSDFRTSGPSGYRNSDYRDDYRRGPDDFRGERDDFRGEMDDFRGGPEGYRGAPDSYRDDQSNYRANDYRDLRGGPQGNPMGPDDDPRNQADFRGNFNYPRGGQAVKGGNFNSRQGNYSAPSRYSSNNSYGNTFSRW